MRELRILVAGIALCVVACGEDLEPCEERIESLDDLIGTWTTAEFRLGEDGAYGWAGIDAYLSSHLTIASGGAVTIVGYVWDQWRYQETEVTGAGTLTLDGDSLTLAWSTVDPALLGQPDRALRFPITFGATLRTVWPEYTDWGLFETVECRATAQRWLDLRADTAAALMDWDLDGRWTPATVMWVLEAPDGTAP